MAEEQPAPPPPNSQTSSQSAHPAPTNFPGDSEHHNSADVAALSSAASNLKVSSTPASTTAPKASTADAKKVKIDAKDVEFLIKELEVSKGKATEMLKAAEGERARAVRTFVVGAVGA